MCGLAGIVQFDGAPVDPAELGAMGESIRHRGPDDEGAVLIDRARKTVRRYSGPDSPAAIRSQHPLLETAVMEAGCDVGLVHRRFSIIDLSPAGHQPMFDADDQVCLVVNGEIYNYVELRDALAGRYAFRTGSDTETILAAYREWGDRAFEQMQGMWALALYDLRERRLVLARDRFGKMPLYWWRDASSLYFASEIKALQTVPRIAAARAVDEASVFPFVEGGFRDLGNRTFFAGIHSLPAAVHADATADFPANAKSYWRLPDRRATEREISPEEAAAGIRDRLREAVRIRLRCDVPWGIELSGGLDSSVLVDLARELTDGSVRTYTVRFPDPEWDESRYADSVARRFGTEHVVIDPPPSGFWGEVASFTRLMEEPYHSPSIHVAQLLRRIMRAQGNKVLLTGAAGDELFAGYSGYFAYHQRDLLRRGALGAFADNARKHTETDNAARNLLFPVERAVRGLGRRTLETLGLFPDRQQDLLTTRELMPSAPRSLAELLVRDMTHTNMPYWLRSGNVMFMGIPIESRSPYLDHRLVEWVFRLPTSYLVRHGWHKWILRRAFAGRLPADVVWRRRKLGFPFPIERFLQESATQVDQVLREHSNPFLGPRALERARGDWRLLSFVLWYEAWFKGGDTLRGIERDHREGGRHPAAAFLADAAGCETPAP